MQQNKLRQMFNDGVPILNGWLSIASPFSAEIMSAQGFDSLTIDVQHGALDYTDLLPMFQAMKASPSVLMARVPWLDPAPIMKSLDAGAMGIICPMINNRAEAEEFASYMRYPPRGQRSYGPTRALFAYADYRLSVNYEVLAIAMVETAEGYQNLEEIASTPGIDGIYVGPSDLTLGIEQGRLPEGLDREEPEMIERIQRIAGICKQNNILACLHCMTPEYATRAVGWGYNLTTVGGDVRFMATGAKAAVSAFHEQNGREALPKGRDLKY